MIDMDSQKARRRRGVILTPEGLKKLQTAKSEAEMEENSGNRYTLEALNERTGLSTDTLMKIFAGEIGVDKQTLKSCFQAFNLVLGQRDYCFPESRPQNEALGTISLVAETAPEIPEGQVPLDSAFYLERPPIEANCYKAILQPGALIRIKAPRRMGKTSLMSRILQSATKEGYCTVSLSFQLADKAIFQQDLDKFLRWFCASISLGLQLPNQLTQYWDELFGSKISSKIYFEQYLLANTTSPIVLGLDDVDCLFQYPDLADDFFGLLRAWHEEAKNREIWKRLRLVVAHATEVYIPLNVNKSPFNVGLPIELQSLNRDQVEALGERYGLKDVQAIDQLFALVGGQPYLVRLAFYYSWQQGVSLEQLLSTALSPTGIYREHLQQQLWNLQQDPKLVTALAQVVTASKPAELPLEQAFKLQSMGLVYLSGNQAIASCQLYAKYFGDFLRDQPVAMA